MDFLDQWSYERNVSARDALLRLLHNHQQAHPPQKVAIVSGDVHNLPYTVRLLQYTRRALPGATQAPSWSNCE